MRYFKVRIGEEINFKCVPGCTICCATGPNVALTIFDVVRIAKALKVHWRDLFPKYLKVIIGDIVPFVSLRDVNNKCIFLEGDKCKIYHARPLRCRLYPLIPPAPNANFFYVDRKCPGLLIPRKVKVEKKLMEVYSKEVTEHYRRIMEKVLNGVEPEEALYKSIEEVWDKTEELDVEFI